MVVSMDDLLLHVDVLDDDTLTGGRGKDGDSLSLLTRDDSYLRFQLSTLQSLFFFFPSIFLPMLLS